MENLQNLTPLKNYTPPSLPTLESEGVNQELLKTLPRRWRKFSCKAAALACTGVMGMAAFSGCVGAYPHGGAMENYLPPEYFSVTTGQGLQYTTTPTDETHMEAASQAQAYFRSLLETSELELRAHFGGSGAGPYYVAYIKEDEAFGFIRAKLESAGLNFDAVPPSYTVEAINEWNFSMPRELTIGLDLFDGQKEVAIAEIRPTDISDPHRDFNRRNQSTGNSTAQEVAEKFMEQFGQTVGVFHNPGESVLNGMQARSDWNYNFWQTYGDTSMEMWEWFNTLSNEIGHGAINAMQNEAINTLRDEAIAERTPEIREALINRLTAQTQEFIEFLQSQGILQPTENTMS